MPFSARVEDFRIENFAHGLDHKRSVAQYAFGHYVAAEAATWESGMVVNLDASGNVVKSTGATPFGIAKYNKNTGKYAAVHGEYIQLNGVVATNLKHAGLLAAAAGVAGVRVYDAGAVYVEAGDYTVSYANGTITRINPGATPIVDGSYVYVDYHYAVTATELMRDGQNFWNMTNDTTIQGNKCVVITGNSRIFTSMYSSADTFTVNCVVKAGTTAEVLEGFVRNAAGAGVAIGRCFQVPTSDDPYLGFELDI
jgi:hypothetical protein